MKRKLIILTTYILLCIYSYSENTTSRDTVVYLNEYDIIDSKVFNLLDTAIIHELKFFRRNCTFGIDFYLKDGNMKLSIGVYDEELLKYYSEVLIGYFNYRGSLFIIGTCNVKTNRFFSKTENKAPFRFKYHSGEIIPIVDETSWTYYYKCGRFILEYLFDVRLKNGGYDYVP